MALWKIPSGSWETIPSSYFYYSDKKNTTVTTGFDGYDTSFTLGQTDITANSKDTEESIYTKTSSDLTNGTNWYFNIKSVDNANNWDDNTDTAHHGPFWICNMSSGIVDSDDDISADRLKNAAATKKLAIFDAFEILNRIEEEKNLLEDKPKVEEKKEKSFKGFAEGRSK